MTPRLTVLLSVYNGERYLRQAIDSILAQTHRDFELLAIDDGSTDDSPRILESYGDPRLRILRNARNIGLTASLNVGLAEARGSLVARHDADDISHPRRLEKQVAEMDARPQLAVVGTGIRGIDEEGRVGGPVLWARNRTPLALRWQLMFESPFSHGTVMMRRDAVLAAGGYDESFRTGQDFDLWSRLVPRYETTNLLEPLVDFRSHAGSVSRGCTLEGVGRVAARIRRNIEETLGSGDYDRWMDFWMSVNNLGLYGTLRGLETFASDLESMFARFVEIYPQARDNREIARQIATSSARVACTIAQIDRRAAARAYRLAMMHDLRTAAGLLPRVSALLVLGPHRRALRTSA